MEFGVVNYADRDAKDFVVEDVKVVDPFTGFCIPFDSLPAHIPAKIDTPTKGKPVRLRDTHGRYVATHESQYEPLLSNTEILHILSTEIFDETQDTSCTSFAYESFGINSISSYDWDKISQDSFDGMGPFQHSFVDTTVTLSESKENNASALISRPATPPSKRTLRPRPPQASPASKFSSTSSTPLTRSLSKRQAATQVNRMEFEMNTPLKDNEGGIRRHTSHMSKKK